MTQLTLVDIELRKCRRKQILVNLVCPQIFHKVTLNPRNSLFVPSKPKSYLLKDMQRKMDFLRTFLKVSKFHKQIFLFSFEPKTKPNISALRIDPQGRNISFGFGSNVYRTICFRNLLTFRSSRHFNTQFEQQCLLPRLYSYLQSYTTFHMRYIRQIQRAICIMSLNGRLPFFPSLLPPSFHICRTNVLSFGVDKKNLDLRHGIYSNS